MSPEAEKKPEKRVLWELPDRRGAQHKTEVVLRLSWGEDLAEVRREVGSAGERRLG